MGVMFYSADFTDSGDKVNILVRISEPRLAVQTLKSIPCLVEVTFCGCKSLCKLQIGLFCVVLFNQKNKSCLQKTPDTKSCLANKCWPCWFPNPQPGAAGGLGHNSPGIGQVRHLPWQADWAINPSIIHLKWCTGNCSCSRSCIALPWLISFY